MLNNFLICYILLLQLSENDLSSHSSYAFISLEETNNALKIISGLFSNIIESEMSSRK